MKYLKALLITAAIMNFAIAVYSQDNVEMTRKRIVEAYDVFNANNIEKINEYIDENCIDHTPFVPDQKPGVEGIKQIFTVLYSAFPDFNQKIEDIIISPDGKKACVLIKITGTNKGEFMGMKPTNNKINFLGCDILYLKDGKMTEHWGFIDNDTMMKQLGMMK